jgi:hypothetical protein
MNSVAGYSLEDGIDFRSRAAAQSIHRYCQRLAMPGGRYQCTRESCRIQHQTKVLVEITPIDDLSPCSFSSNFLRVLYHFDLTGIQNNGANTEEADCTSTKALKSAFTTMNDHHDLALWGLITVF